MNKTLVFILIIGMLSISLVSAHENFTETKQLIDSKISCDKLADEQLEEIVDYYMEQMHPGEAHEMMHKMMGGENSEFVKLMHITMAKSIYCGENTMMQGVGGYGMGGSGGMMSMMNMMSQMMSGRTPNTNVMQGMMGSWYGYGYWNFVNALYAILLIGLVILAYLWVVRLWKDLPKKRR